MQWPCLCSALTCWHKSTSISVSTSHRGNAKSARSVPWLRLFYLHTMKTFGLNLMHFHKCFAVFLGTDVFRNSRYFRNFDISCDINDQSWLQKNLLETKYFWLYTETLSVGLFSSGYLLYFWSYEGVKHASKLRIKNCQISTHTRAPRGPVTVKTAFIYYIKLSLHGSDMFPEFPSPFCQANLMWAMQSSTRGERVLLQQLLNFPARCLISL